METFGEFEFIEFIKKRFPVSHNFMGIGDDCAIISQGGDDLLFSTDFLVEGVHFLKTISSAEDVGWKAAAVNLSDIAAMGGTPIATFLSIALPKSAQGDWAKRFIEGFVEISRLFDVPLLGGDTTSSLRDIAVNVGILGQCPSGKGIKRNNAKIGETIYVTGNLGDSAGGLYSVLKGIDKTVDVETLINRHKRPVPRISEGKTLMMSGKVGAMMDISDGIASDLKHIMKASGVGAVVEIDKLPYSKELISVSIEYGWDRCKLAVGGGEDFELLFTAPEDFDKQIDIPIYPIGKIVCGKELIWTIDNKPVDLNFTGYKHF